MQSLGQSKRSRGSWWEEMGHREALAYKRKQSWETGCTVKVPIERQGKKVESGVFNQINSKKSF